jgi:hypothetical protein
MKKIETEIREYAQVMINLPEEKHEISFDGFSSKDYINYLSDLICNKFGFEPGDSVIWKIAQEELEK